METIKCITFDKKSQDSLPEQIKAKMKIDRENAEIANEFEKELFMLINQFCKMGLKKPDLVHKMQYVTKSCELS